MVVAEADLSGWHLRPLRPDVWVRPDNLQRRLPAGHDRFVARFDGDPGELVCRATR